MPERLPTRQLNALRLLLDKHDFSADEVATLDYVKLVRAPGIGHKGIEIIHVWLTAHGRDLLNWPEHNELSAREQQATRKVEQAIDLLTRHGYAVNKRA